MRPQRNGPRPQIVQALRQIGGCWRLPVWNGILDESIIGKQDVSIANKRSIGKFLNKGSRHPSDIASSRTRLRAEGKKRAIISVKLCHRGMFGSYSDRWCSRLGLTQDGVCELVEKVTAGGGATRSRDNRLASQESNNTYSSMQNFGDFKFGNAMQCNATDTWKFHMIQAGEFMTR
jgi:hypothetical protein